MLNPRKQAELDQAHASLANTLCPLWAAMFHNLIGRGVSEASATQMVCVYIEVSVSNINCRSLDPLDDNDISDDNSDPDAD